MTRLLPRVLPFAACLLSAAAALLSAPASAQLQPKPKLIAYGLTAPGFLIRFDTRAPRRSTRTIGWTFPDGGGVLVGLDFRPDGVLVGVDNRGLVYRIALDTAQLTQLGLIPGGLIGARFGVDVDPRDGRLHVVSDFGQHLAFDFASGTTQVLPSITEAQATLYGTSGLAFDAAGVARLLDYERDRLLALDPATGVATAIAPLRAARRFAAPPTLIGGDGFDIAPPSVSAEQAAFVSLKPESGADAVLHRIDLATGAVTALGAVNPDPSGDLLDFSIQP